MLPITQAQSMTMETIQTNCNWFAHLLCLQDVEKENNLPLQEVSIDDILELQREEQLQKQQDAERKNKAMQDRGLPPHVDPIQEDFF